MAKQKWRIENSKDSWIFYKSDSLCQFYKLVSPLTAYFSQIQTSKPHLKLHFLLRFYLSQIPTYEFHLNFHFRLGRSGNVDIYVDILNK